MSDHPCSYRPGWPRARKIAEPLLCILLNHNGRSTRIRSRGLPALFRDRLVTAARGRRSPTTWGIESARWPTTAAGRRNWFAGRRPIHGWSRLRWWARPWRWIRVHRRVRSRRGPWTARRRWPMQPIVFSTVPRAASVIAIPVVAHTECHDADPQTGPKLNDGHAAVLIVVIQIIAVNPAAVAFPVHIAPGPVIETTIYI
jgi:hypothetical protein